MRIGEEIDPETNEEIWYIGHQGFIGPTDEERWVLRRRGWWRGERLGSQ